MVAQTVDHSTGAIGGSSITKRTSSPMLGVAVLLRRLPIWVRTVEIATPAERAPPRYGGPKRCAGLAARA